MTGAGKRRRGYRGQILNLSLVTAVDPLRVRNAD